MEISGPGLSVLYLRQVTGNRQISTCLNDGFIMWPTGLSEAVGVIDQNFLAGGCFLPGDPLPEIIGALDGVGHNPDGFIVRGVIQNR